MRFRFENHDAGQIYGNTRDAPYINGTLPPAYAHATNFTDELPSLPDGGERLHRPVPGRILSLSAARRRPASGPTAA